ncbi:MAG: DUF1778 domain-containing protein [Acidobacteriota bacterium]
MEAKQNLKETRLIIKTSMRQKERIAKAARLKKISVNDFVLENAAKAASQVLAEQADFTLSKKQWKKFCEALDAPPRKIPALKKLLTSPSAFDEQ